MGSNHNATTVATTTNSFSIRDYVTGAREQDIRNNWPFHEKYLEVCLKHGINKLLPPFESLYFMRCSSNRELIRFSCTRGRVGSNSYTHAETNVENEVVKVESGLCIDEAISEITKQMSPLSLSADNHKHDDSGLSSDMKGHTSTFKTNFDSQTLASIKSSRIKQKKHKGKHKKRSMAEIYAKARRCTLEDFKISESALADVPRGKSFVCDPSATESEKIVDELNESMTTVDHDYRHKPSVSLKMKHARDGNRERVSNGGGKKRILKIKFGGCKSKAHNGNQSLKTD